MNMHQNSPCRHCGHCPHCGQPMPVAGPYLPYYPPVYPGIVPYVPGPYIYPTTTPVQPWPRDVYIGDPLPGWSTVTVSMNNTVYAN